MRRSIRKFISILILVSSAYATAAAVQGPSPFAILGVRENATYAECETAFGDLAEAFHPERNHGDRVAIENFQIIVNAWKQIQKDHAPITIDPTEKAARQTAERIYDDKKIAVASSVMKAVIASTGSHHDRIAQIIPTIEKHYADSFEKLLNYVRENLFHGEESEVLVRAVTTYLLLPKTKAGNLAAETLKQMIYIESNNLYAAADSKPKAVMMGDMIHLQALLKEIETAHSELQPPQKGFFARVAAKCANFLIQ